jgi:hypothetical protein
VNALLVVKQENDGTLKSNLRHLFYLIFIFIKFYLKE